MTTSLKCLKYLKCSTVKCFRHLLFIFSCSSRWPCFNNETQGKWCHSLRHSALTQDASGSVTPSAYWRVQSVYNTSQTVPQRGLEIYSCKHAFSSNVQSTDDSVINCHLNNSFVNAEKQKKKTHDLHLTSCHSKPVWFSSVDWKRTSEEFQHHVNSFCVLWKKVIQVRYEGK